MLVICLCLNLRSCAVQQLQLFTAQMPCYLRVTQ